MGEDAGSLVGDKLEMGGKLGTELEVEGAADTGPASVGEREGTMGGVVKGALEMGDVEGDGSLTGV